MEVLYSRNYIERDLYVLEYQGKYLMVYRSSGLNAGRKGRFLPFCFLSEASRPTIGSEVPGYIYKEFYFGGKFISHSKNPQRMGQNIGPFLEKIEEDLKNNFPEKVPYGHIKTYKDLRPVAIEINTELREAIEGLEPLDWSTL